MDDSMVGYLYDDGISFPVRPSPAAYGDYGSPFSSLEDHSGHIYESRLRMEGHNRHLSPCMVGRERLCHRPASAVSSRPYGDLLYPASLVAFDRETKEKMGRLKWKLISSDPRYAQDLGNWNGRRRRGSEVLSSKGCEDEQENKRSIFLPSKDIVRSGWTNLSSDADDDDRSSVSGAETAGFGNYCYLCSTLDEHKKHLVQQGLQQKPKHLPKPRVKYVVPPPKVIRKAMEETEDDGGGNKERTVFRVSVKTGKHRNAGTSGNVFIQLQGNRGLSRRKQLTRKHSVRFTFGVDTTEIFYIKTADVGSLEAILVEHDCLEKNLSWFLDWIEIINIATKERVVFSCDNWLSLQHGDKKSKRILKCSSKTNDNSLTDYEVEVYTGSKSMAGTNASVFVTFYGRKGTSARLQLKSKEGRRAFQKGSRDNFHLETKSLGPLTGLRIEHNNTGTAPGWFLDKIAVLDSSTGSKYVFPCNQWLALDEGDGKLSKMLQPLNAASGKGPSEIEYEVQVFTGTQMSAGTDANVFVSLYGAKGSSARVQLKKSMSNNFEKGGKDLFRVMAADVGSITKLKIDHDNSGAAPGWFLDKVIVTNSSTRQSQTFPCGQWLAKDEGDGSLCRTLQPLETNLNKSKQMINKEKSMRTYDVQVSTGNVSNGGTDANVFLTLYGLNGTTTKTKLKNQSRNNFERGKTDVFAIEVEDVGEVSSIRIEHDNSGIGPGWYLDKVVLTDRKSHKSYEFACGLWLATDEDDGIISRKLYLRTDDERDETASRRTSSVSTVTATRRSHDSLRF